MLADARRGQQNQSPGGRHSIVSGSDRHAGASERPRVSAPQQTGSLHNSAEAKAHAGRLS